MDPHFWDFKRKLDFWILKKKTEFSFKTESFSRMSPCWCVREGGNFGCQKFFTKMLHKIHHIWLLRLGPQQRLRENLTKLYIFRYFSKFLNRCISPGNVEVIRNFLDAPHVRNFQTSTIIDTSRYFSTFLNISGHVANARKMSKSLLGRGTWRCMPSDTPV